MADFPVNEIIAVLVTLFSILLAWWQNRLKKETVEFYTVPTVVPSVPPKAVSLGLPERSYLMAEWTKKWITFGESEEDKNSLLQQVSIAEEQGLTGYTIRYSKGYYEINWGLIKASGRDK